MSKETIVVNLFAGPGTGKSTFCAGIFAALKWKDVDCEMALEYAKDLTWESSSSKKSKKKKVKNPKLENQVYVFGKQQHRFFRLKGKVDVIVTDSPMLHSVVYDVGNKKALKELILEEHSLYNNLNIFLKRKKKYNPNGRSQTLEQAKELDEKIKDMLDTYAAGYLAIDAVPKNINTIVNLVMKKLKERDKNKSKRKSPKKKK